MCIRDRNKYTTKKIDPTIVTGNAATIPFTIARTNGICPNLVIGPAITSTFSNTLSMKDFFSVDIFFPPLIFKNALNVNVFSLSIYIVYPFTYFFDILSCRKLCHFYLQIPQTHWSVSYTHLK